MKYFLLVFFAVTFSCINGVYAQQNTSLVYSQNFEIAKEMALKENKDILLIFSGSDWCKPCAILEKNILQDSVFIVFANKNLNVYKADFPRKKKNKLEKSIEDYNNKLASKYNKSGEFPKAILFSSDAKLKAVLVYNNISVNEFINQIKKK